MRWIYHQVGRLLFSRQQAWEQQKSAKTVVFTVAFSLILGLLLAITIRIMYRHQA